MSISVLFAFELFLLRGAARLFCRWSVRVRIFRIPQRQLTVATPNLIGQGATAAKAAFLAASRVTYQSLLRLRFHARPRSRLVVAHGRTSALAFGVRQGTCKRRGGWPVSNTI